jgi:hypothetical protein
MTPVVAIVGSAEAERHYDIPVRDVTGAISAAEDIGRELARAGCRIVAHSGNGKFIERAVVAGFVASGHAGPGSVEIRGRYGGADADFGIAADDRHVLDVRPEPAMDWEVAFYRSLLSADAMILIGGGRSTFIAGLIAISRRIPLAPVAAFGGDAEKVWHYFSRERNWASDQDVAALGRDWRSESATDVVAALLNQDTRRQEERDQQQDTQRRTDRRAARSLALGLLLLVCALATIPWAYTVHPGGPQSLAAILLAPLLAAMCGSIVRSAYDGTDGWIRTMTLGASAGSVTFLLFIAAQLTTTPELLNGDGARRLLFFVIPISFTAGLTFDVVYNKLRSQDVTQTSVIGKSMDRTTHG